MKKSRFRIEEVVFDRFVLKRLIGIHCAGFEVWEATNREAESTSCLFFLPSEIGFSTAAEERFREWLSLFLLSRGTEGGATDLEPVEYYSGADSAFEMTAPSVASLQVLEEAVHAFDGDSPIPGKVCEALSRRLERLHAKGRAQGYFDSGLVFLDREDAPVFPAAGLVQCVLDELHRIDPKHAFFLDRGDLWPHGTVKGDVIYLAELLAVLPWELPRKCGDSVRRVLDRDPSIGAGDFLSGGETQSHTAGENGRRAEEASSSRAAKSNDPAVAPHRDLQRYVIPGLVGVVILGIFALATRKSGEPHPTAGKDDYGEFAIPEDWFATPDDSAGGTGDESLKPGEGRNVGDDGAGGTLAETRADAPKSETVPLAENSPVLSADEIEKPFRVTDGGASKSEATGETGEAPSAPEEREAVDPGVAARSADEKAPAAVPVPETTPLVAGSPPPVDSLPIVGFNPELSTSPLSPGLREEPAPQEGTGSEALSGVMASPDEEEDAPIAQGQVPERTVSREEHTLPAPSIATIWLDPPRASADGPILGYSEAPVTAGEWSKIMGEAGSGPKGDVSRLRPATPTEARRFLETLTDRDHREGRLPTDHFYDLPGKTRVKSNHLLTKGDDSGKAMPFTFVVVAGPAAASSERGGKEKLPSPARIGRDASGRDIPLWTRPQ
jgi:hypothetical protein